MGPAAREGLFESDIAQRLNKDAEASLRGQVVQLPEGRCSEPRICSSWLVSWVRQRVPFGPFAAFDPFFRPPRDARPLVAPVRPHADPRVY